MSRASRLSCPLVILAAVVAGCAPRVRCVNEAGAEWKAEVATYPRVVRWTKRTFPPGDPESLSVYYARPNKPAYATMGHGTAPPPQGLSILADLAVFRGPLPDHEGALAELRHAAAALGADTLTEVQYTVVVGDTRIGGSALVGWIYVATARRTEVKR